MFCCPSVWIFILFKQKNKNEKNLLINNNLLSTSPMTKNLEHVRAILDCSTNVS